MIEQPHDILQTRGIRVTSPTVSKCRDSDHQGIRWPVARRHAIADGQLHKASFGTHQVIRILNSTISDHLLHELRVCYVIVCHVGVRSHAVAGRPRGNLARHGAEWELLRGSPRPVVVVLNIPKVSLLPIRSKETVTKQYQTISKVT